MFFFPHQPLLESEKLFLKAFYDEKKASQYTAYLVTVYLTLKLKS